MIPAGGISASELAQRLTQGGNLLVLDVREKDEVAQGKILGAVHIPLGELPYRLGELDPKAETVVVCHSGARSSRAVQYLMQQGWSQVHNLQGGMVAWAKERARGGIG